MMPDIDILLVTYNHEMFVRQALDSILMQSYSGSIKITVADDASTDATVDFIREYEGNDPRVSIRYLDNSKNLGITKNYQRAFAACAGEYIAVLEGDDYWTSPDKLSKQIGFLMSHRECVLCSANYIVYEEEFFQYKPRIEELDGWSYLTSRSLIFDNVIGNFSTCVYRASALRNLPKGLFEIKAYDWALHICLGKFGLIAFLNEPMSIYRVHPKGSWSLLTHKEKLSEQLELLPQYNLITNNVFQEEFDKLRRQLIDAGATSMSIMKKNKFKKHIIIRTLRFAHKICPPIIVVLVKLITPPIITGRIRGILNR